MEQMSIFDLVGQLSVDNTTETPIIDESVFQEVVLDEESDSYANTTEDLCSILAALDIEGSTDTNIGEILNVDMPEIIYSESTMSTPADNVMKDIPSSLIEFENHECNSEFMSPVSVVHDEAKCIDSAKISEKIVSSNVVEFSRKRKTSKLVKGKSVVKKGYSPSKEVFSTTPLARFEDNLCAIRLVNEIEENSRSVVSSDLTVLGKFSGWGGLSEFFEKEHPRNGELLDVLGSNYNSASRSVLTGYYTPPEVIKFVYSLMRRLGFEKGNILDCSAGTGRFFSYMNKSIYQGSNLYGVELDEISSKICSILHPSASISNAAFEKTKFEDEYFDLSISNIPFGDLLVYDSHDQEINKHKLKIHDYFFVKALKKVRTGGLVAFITSAGFMDKQNIKVRELIGKTAELVGAFRLPNNTFSGTKVVSDVVVFRKTSMPSDTKAWLNSVPLKAFDDQFSVNELFVRNPQLICGTFSKTSSQYGESLTVVGEELTDSLLKSKLKLFPSDIYVPREDESYLYKQDDLIYEDSLDSLGFESQHSWVKDLRQDEYVYIEGGLYKKEFNYLVKQKESIPKYEILKSYALLKGALMGICTNRDCTDEELSNMQIALNKQYDDFVEYHGYINDYKNRTVLSKDHAGFPLVSALEDVAEVYDEEENKIVKVYKKADIFTKRTIGRSAVVSKPKTLQEAIILSFYLVGKLDVELMSEKMEVEYSKVLNGCLENNLIYYNFELCEYEEASEFLSGYVKDKLKYNESLLDRINEGSKIVTVPIKKESFLSNPEDALACVEDLRRNIDALRENQPDFEENVEFGLSSTWIPSEVKKQFLIDTLHLGKNIEYLKLEYDEKLGYKLTGCYMNTTLRTAEWGTTRAPADKIILHALNDTAPEIKDKYDGKEYVNIEQTQLAIAKVNKWLSEFKNYIFDNPDLHLEIVQIYNDLFVRTKEKEQFNFIFDPETSPNVHLRECQLKGVCRSLTSKVSQLLFYETGVGKTYTMQVLAYMKYKIRMQAEGRPNKTIIAVPNPLALSGQFAREFLNIYPNARILALNPKDFEKKNRRRILSKIATNNWHAVIIPHSVLELIPLKSETLEKYFQQDIRDMERSIYNYEQSGDRRSVFRMEKMISNRKAQMESLLDIHKDESSIFWEDLGVDNLIVDEAHHYKSLFFVTKKERIAGISNRASKCASNLYNMVRYQQEKDPSSVTFATATPITNTIGELYNFSRYLNPEGLRKRGVYEFDAWASAFGSVINEVETDVTGRGFNMKPRFSKFYNIPELMQIVKEFADIVFTNDVSEIKVPNLVTGKPINIEVEPTNLGEQAIQALVELVGEYESGSSEIKKAYNMLKICGEGRKIAVSQRLLSKDELYEPLNDISKKIHATEELSPKLTAVIEKVYEIYLKHPDMGQAVFCDIGVPKVGQYSAYQEIKDGLMSKGLTSEDIVFIHDCGDSPQKREEVIKKFNDGMIKVLIGSTSKMGEGTNFQKRLVALHHVDSCWLPSQIKQREGRILRHGNVNKEVYILRYVMKNSFDVFSWQTLERKAKFIHQITSGAKDLRSVDDLGSESISYAEAKAAASGNPLLIEHCSLVSKYNDLKVQEKNYSMVQVKNKNRIEFLKNSISRKNTQNHILASEIESVRTYDLDYVTFSKSGVDYTDKESILEILKNTLKVGAIGFVYGLTVTIDTYLNEISIGESGLVDFSLVTHQAAIYKRFESLLSVMEKSLSVSIQLVSEYEKELEFLEDYIKRPFSLKDELVQIERRKTDIEALLYGSKNQVEQMDGHLSLDKAVSSNVVKLSPVPKFETDDPIEYFEVL